MKNKELEKNNNPARFAEYIEKTLNEVKNGFLRFLLGIPLYIALFFYDFYQSLRRYPTKLAAILIASPGVLIGFFLGIHYNAVIVLANYPYYALLLFILVLFSTINIFNGVSVNSKKSIGAAIVTALTTLILSAAGIFYVILFFKQGTNVVFNNNNVLIAVVCIIISVVLSITGSVLAFIYRDKNYKREKF